MQIILLVSIFGIMLANFTSFGGAWLIKQKKDLALEKSINNTTRTFDNLHNKTLRFNVAKTKKVKLDKEVVQKVLIRTCNAVYQKGILNHCSGASSVHNTWKFLEDSGTFGGLSSAWNNSRTSTFSCGVEGSYGRYLLHNAIPKSMILKYGYDLRGISDIHAYPCGYSEIVYKL